MAQTFDDASPGNLGPAPLGDRRLALRLPPAVTFTLRRLVVLALQLVAITLVSFALTHIVPADPVAANLSVEAQSDPRIVAAFRHKFGLDQPAPMQYVKYMQQLVHGDFGLSLQTGAPVRQTLAEAAPASFELAGVAVVIAVLFGVGLGIVLGIGLARGAVKGALNALIIGSLSAPTFWLALLGYYLLFYRLGLFPSGGRLDPGAAPPPHVTGFYTLDSLLFGQWATFGSALHHLLLPALVLAGSTIGVLIRYTSAAVQEASGNDYVRSGRAKGLTEWTVVLRYVVRPALLSIITVAGVAFGHLLAGTVLVESVFDWPGLGQYAYRSALALDVPAVIGVTIVIAFIYVGVNFCVDLCYPVIDPRLGPRA
jgi:peptide/nickel transport system permease protein